MPNNKNATSDNKAPLDYERGGHNPRPAKSTKRTQVGPTPTTAKPGKATPSTEKKIREEGTKQD